MTEEERREQKENRQEKKGADRGGQKKKSGRDDMGGRLHVVSNCGSTQEQRVNEHNVSSHPRVGPL